MSKMTVQKMQINSEANRYISHVNTSPKPISFPNNQQRPRHLSNNSVKQFTSPTHITHTLPNQVLSRLTEPNLVPVTTYTLLSSRYKPRQDKDSYHNVQQLDPNMSKMTVQKTQSNSGANRYKSHINSSPQPLSLPNNQQRPRDLSNNSVKQFKQFTWVGSSDENFQSSRGEPVSLNNRYKQTTKFPPNSPQIHLNEIKNVNDDESNVYPSHYTTDINPSPGQIEPKSSYTIPHTTHSPKPHPVYHNTVNYKKLPLPHEPRHYDQSQHGEHTTVTDLSELDPFLNGKLQVRHDSFKPNYIPNKQTTVKNNMPVVVTKIKETYSNEKLNHHSSDDAQEFIDHYQQTNVSPAMPVVHKYNQSGGMNKLYIDKNYVPPRSHQMTSDLKSSEINPLTASYPNVLGQTLYPAESQMKFPPTQSQTAHSNPDPTNPVPGRVPLEKDPQNRLKFEPSQVVNPDKKPHSTPSRHFQNTHLPGSVNHRPNDNLLHADNANQNPLHHNRLPNNLPYPLQKQNLPVSEEGEKSRIQYHHRPRHSWNNPHVGHKNPSHFNPNQPQSIQKPQPHLETPYYYNHHENHKNPSHFNPNQPHPIQKPQPHLETPYYYNHHEKHKNPSHFNPNQPQSIQKPQPHLETPYYYNHHEPRDGGTPRSVDLPNHANTVLHTHLPERNINQPLHLQPSPENINVVGLQHPLPLPEGPSNPKGFINQTPNYNQEQYPPRINPNQYPNSQHQNNANKNPNSYTDGQLHQRPDLQEAIHNNKKQNKYPIPNFEAIDSPSPQQSHPIPGLLDHHKTYDNYQYPMNSEYLPSPGNHPPNAESPPTLDQPTTGISGNSAPAFAYSPPSQAVESLPDPQEPQSFDNYTNKNQHLELTKDQQISENIDSNEPFDFDVDNHTLDNLHTPPQLPFEPYSNENSLEYTDSGKNPNIKEYNDPHSPPLQENPNTSGNFDDPGSNGDYFLPEHNSPQNIYKIPHKENSSDVLDDTTEGFTYPPSSEDITHSNNLSEHPHPNTSSTDNPDFNIRGLDTGFEYISESTEDTTHTKRPISETEIPYNFDDHGSGGAYTSKSVENQNKSPWKPHVSTTVSPRNRNPEIGEYKPFFNNSWSPKEVDKIHESESASTPKLNHDYNELEDGRATVWNPTESENELLHLNSNVLANLLSVVNGTKNMNKLYPSLILLIKSLTKPNLNNSEFDDSGLDEVDFLPVLLSILAKYQDDINKLNHKLYNTNKSNVILLEKITANEYKPEDEIDVQRIYDMLSKLPTLDINITNINVTNDDVEEYLLKLIHNIQEKALETTTYPGDDKITITAKFKSSTPAASHSKYPDLQKVLQEFQDGDPLDLLALVNNLPVDNTSQGDSDDKPIKSRFSNPKPNHMFKGDGNDKPIQSRYSNPKPNYMFKGDGDDKPIQSGYSNPKPNYMFKGDGDDKPIQSGYLNPKPNHMFKGDGDTKPIQSRFSNPKPNHMFKHKLKDQKEECGDGTVWLKNCHECRCKSGHAYCIKIPDCVPRPLDEPMMCKPFTHFNMGACYTCECNADGIPECDGSNCAGHVPPMDEEIDKGKEFFDEEKTKEIIQYYNTYKKLPKECSDSSFLYQTCKPGTSWTSDCHDCKCNDKGKHECTKTKECDMRNVHYYDGASKCKPNTKFYPKSSGMPCVECSCDDNGEPHCPTNDHRK
ncbi:uncharacterized protein LOC111362623 [Spodoptera litura]|uniref:Uncharacterized protein LOC111362623 n=1 Tax=Spodoptera litura TaxID=69820 RepID=A0A9J7ETR2_SPOLT|nr:uncharacterized protein LOC111362623 [Spodoptera litura]